MCNGYPYILSSDRWPTRIEQGSFQLGFRIFDRQMPTDPKKCACSQKTEHFSNDIPDLGELIKRFSCGKMKSILFSDNFLK